MAFIPVPLGVRSSIVYLAEGQICVNTLHFRFATVPTVTNMANLNTALHTWYTGTLKATVPSNFGLSQINTVSLENQSAPSSVLSISPLEFGTSGTNSMPMNVAWCASLRTVNRGRNFRGRYYSPGVPTSFVSGTNSMNPTSAGQIQTALAALLTPANVANFIWVIASRYFARVPRVSGIMTDVNAVVGDLTMDSQRRRLPGRGA